MGTALHGVGPVEFVSTSPPRRRHLQLVAIEEPPPDADAIGRAQAIVAQNVTVALSGIVDGIMDDPELAEAHARLIEARREGESAYREALSRLRALQRLRFERLRALFPVLPAPDLAASERRAQEIDDLVARVDPTGPNAASSDSD